MLNSFFTFGIYLPQLMNKYFLFGVLFSLLFSCTPKEDPLKKEQREMKEALESAEATIYRGLKISLRSLPGNLTDSSSIERPATKIQALTFNLLHKALRIQNKDSAFSLTDYLNAATDLYSLRDQVGKTNEDDYPTILELFLSVDNPVDKQQFKWYNASYEHLLLAIAWTGTSAPRALRMYEISMTNPEKIDDPSTRLLAYFVRGSSFHLEHWDHSSEKEFSDYLACLEKNREAVLKFFLEQELYKLEKKNSKQVYAELRACGLGMRGIARMSAGKEEESMDDLEAFLTEAETAGIDNEALWTVGAYVSLKKEKKEDALGYLGKLEKSSLLDAQDKGSIVKVKKYVEEREPGKAMNLVFDNVFIAKILTLQLKRQVATVDWYGKIEQSPTGNKFLGFGTSLQAEYEKLSVNSAASSLGDKAKGLFNKITE